MLEHGHEGHSHSGEHRQGKHWNDTNFAAALHNLALGILAIRACDTGALARARTRQGRRRAAEEVVPWHPEEALCGSWDERQWTDGCLPLHDFGLVLGVDVGVVRCSELLKQACRRAPEIVVPPVLRQSGP